MAAGANFTPRNLTRSFLFNRNMSHSTLQVIPVMLNSSEVGPQYGQATTPVLAPPKGGDSNDDSSSHVLAYVLVPLGSLLFIAALSFLVVFILRKSKLDKLRHHLMPLYNFDPAEEEEGDWESELLEEDKEQTMALNKHPSSPLNGPTLKFRTDGLDV